MARETCLFEITSEQAAYLFTTVRKLGVSASEYVGRLIADDEIRQSAPAPVAPAKPSPARDFLKESVELARAQKTGDKFKLRALHDRLIWKQIAHRNRLGIDFRTAVEEAGIARKIGKDDMNVAVYERL